VSTYWNEAESRASWLVPKASNQVRNATDAPVRVAVVATNNEFGIVEYPELEKVGIWAGPENYVLDRPK
jgi:hypothetical protein